MAIPPSLAVWLLSSVVAVVAPVSGRLADRIGTRWLGSAGLALLRLGLVCLARLDEQTGMWSVIGPS